MPESVTVLIPVGPNYTYGWLYEAFKSANEQTYPVDEIFLVDDGAALCDVKNNKLDYPFPPGPYIIDQPQVTYTNGKRFWYNADRETFYSIWETPTNVGFTAAFNMGIALARNELVVYLAADDRLMPEAVEKAVSTWQQHDKKDAWYAFSYIDSNGKEGYTPINAAMTTKHFFFDMCGGFPPAAFVGPDAALMSCLIVHAPDRIIHVEYGKPLYWIRDHAQQETKTHTLKYMDEMNSIRNKLTLEFKLREG